MTQSPSTAHLISIAGQDRIGVVSSVTGYLFEIGANLADTAYAILGEGFEFSCVVNLEGLMTGSELAEGLVALEQLHDTRINVVRFPFNVDRPDSGEISHILEIQGGDRVGLVSSISDVLQKYDANIVRMNSRRLEDSTGAVEYRMRFALNVDSDKYAAFDTALVNTAGSLRLTVDLQEK